MYNRFDPMTGEPIQEPMQEQYGEVYFDPMTGEPVGGKKKKKGFLKVIIPAAAVAVVGLAAAAAAGVKSGAFLSKPDKVLAAIANTFRDKNHFAEVFYNAAAFRSDEYTFELDGESSEYDVSASYLVGQSQQQFIGTVNVPSAPQVSLQCELTDEQLRVQIPMVSSRVFTYDYTKEKTGYLTAIVEADQLEMVDQLLSGVSSVQKQENTAAKIGAAVLGEYRSFAFEKAAEETFEVDGKDRKCKGYQTLVKAEQIVKILDQIEDIYTEDFGTGIFYAAGGAEIKEAFEEIKDDVRELPDMEWTFYLYKNKLACFRIEAPGEKIDWQFLGGETRTQNMKIIVDGTVVVQQEGETNGSKETVRLGSDNETIMEMTYDYKTGDLELASPTAEFLLEGNLLADKNGLTAEIRKLEFDGEDLAFTGSLSVTKGASFKTIEGEEFNVGEASMEAYAELQTEMQALLGL